ncbi:uncharacterized protein ASPGLDRAFT_41923 [Aspergillus glaucus CBS 516.65]|uniref:Uncharacterized protein n=1 Tax=Aspergillus glaucus CBS 516.65 TaxID=1160497 RepID=A0A1L9VWS8_ASPGL|nr:hypothetical protein ASPGLDRAFT_41923 [Aspergillus glaucus CBS 516.65]OJJ88356.1 hypothetical protein ASPGLDRAFT_41923 [Aspergillus glaucus CBS 516.65]
MDQLRSKLPSCTVSFEECDVSSGKSQAAVFEKIDAQQRRIDIVFTNAAITEKGSLLPLQNEDGSKGPSKPNFS